MRRDSPGRRCFPLWRWGMGEAVGKSEKIVRLELDGLRRGRLGRRASRRGRGAGRHEGGAREACGRKDERDGALAGTRSEASNYYGRLGGLFHSSTRASRRCFAARRCQARMRFSLASRCLSRTLAALLPPRGAALAGPQCPPNKTAGCPARRWRVPIAAWWGGAGRGTTEHARRTSLP